MSISVQAEYLAELAESLRDFSYKGKEQDVKHLLESVNINIPVNQKDQWGYTALMYASREGYFNIVQMLLEHGGALNLQNVAGDSALIWAAQRGKKDIVRLLVEKGAETSIVNNFGYTALDYAKGKRRPTSTNPFLISASDELKEKCEKMREGDLEIIEIIERGKKAL